MSVVIMRRIGQWAAAIALAAVAVTGTTGTSHASVTGASLSDTGQMAAWFGKVVNDQLRQLQIPGAAVAVVADGRQVFAGGYGLADVSRERPVSAGSTPFFMASVGKLFTATAVMQLADQGKIDLNADVNRYLTRFKVPDTYPGKPVTVANLLTHTAGFDDQLFGVYTTHGDNLQSLGDFLATHIPARVSPPGRVTSYSNYGYALAVYLVQVISGMPFADYVARHIFQPLGMTRSTVAEPAPATIAGGIATAYRPAGRQQAVAPVQYGFEPPAGDGNAATVTDMGRFMLANLQGGALNGHRLMSAAALRLMQRTAFRNDPRIPGMTYGFEEGIYNGWPLLSKGGDVIGTHANLTLIPSANTGIYVAYNGQGTGGGGELAGRQLVQRFIDRFLPRKSSPGGTAPGAGNPGAGSVSRFAGDYRINRFSHTTFTRLSVLFQTVTVKTGPGGTLTTNGLSLDPAADPQHWVPAGAGLFREQGGPGLIAFGEDGSGNVTALYSSGDPTVAFDRLPWYESPQPQIFTIGALLLLIVFMTLFWPVSALVRQRRGGTPQGVGALTASWVAWGTCALLTLFVGGFVWLIRDFNVFLETVTVGTASLLRTILVLPTLAAIGAAGFLACAALAWRYRWWKLGGRIYYTATAVAVALFLAMASTYNLVGWPLL